MELEILASESEVKAFLTEKERLKPRIPSLLDIDFGTRWELPFPPVPQTVAQQQVEEVKGLTDSPQQKNTPQYPSQTPQAQSTQSACGKKKKRRKKFRPYSERIEELRKQERNLLEKLRVTNPTLAVEFSRDLPAPRFSDSCICGNHPPSSQQLTLTIGGEKIPFPTTRKERIEALIRYSQLPQGRDLLQQLVDQL